LYLPFASGNNQILFINLDGDPGNLGLNIIPKAGETVDGNSPYTFISNNGSITLIADGTSNWITVTRTVDSNLSVRSLEITQGPRRTKHRTVYFNYTLAEDDEVLYINAVSGSVVIFVPDVGAYDTIKYYIKRIDAGGNTVVLSGTIDYDPNLSLGNYESIILIGSNENGSWFIH